MTTTPVPSAALAKHLAGARRQSGARAVYDLLRTRIIDGTLAPGARLTEPVLSAQLGVSRTPVREALRLLQAEALVVELPTGGVRVAALDLADARRVYEVRARLEGLLARDACERAGPDDVA
ncbi:GntR family transcriptional regulator, partial [Cellulosimicrobium sp. Marseille-Q8652]